MGPFFSVKRQNVFLFEKWSSDSGLVKDWKQKCTSAPSWSTSLACVCQSDVYLCAATAWINIYITPLSKMLFPESPKNLKYFSWVWRSTLISKTERMAQRHTKALQAGISFYENNPYMCMIRTNSPPILSPPWPKMNTQSSGKFHSAVQDHVLRWEACYYQRWQKKYQFGIFFKRLKILNESEGLRGPSDLTIKRNSYLTSFFRLQRLTLNWQNPFGQTLFWPLLSHKETSGRRKLFFASKLS